ncbi:TPA_asm: non-structural polyprotein [Psammechinus miliaris associated picornavirus 1]|nr:TPA_asm: non-structural polyprotein [Psammechinus miliaris associated picornavirus 1]
MFSKPNRENTRESDASLDEKTPLEVEPRLPRWSDQFRADWSAADNRDNAAFEAIYALFDNNIPIDVVYRVVEMSKLTRTKDDRIPLARHSALRKGCDNHSIISLSSTTKMKFSEAWSVIRDQKKELVVFHCACGESLKNFTVRENGKIEWKTQEVLDHFKTFYKYQCTNPRHKCKKSFGFYDQFVAHTQKHGGTDYSLAFQKLGDDFKYETFCGKRRVSISQYIRHAKFCSACRDPCGRAYAVTQRISLPCGAVEQSASGAALHMINCLECVDLLCACPNKTRHTCQLQGLPIVWCPHCDEVVTTTPEVHAGICYGVQNNDSCPCGCWERCSAVSSEHIAEALSASFYSPLHERVARRFIRKLEKNNFKLPVAQAFFNVIPDELSAALEDCVKSIKETAETATEFMQDTKEKVDGLIDDTSNKFASVFEKGSAMLAILNFLTSAHLYFSGDLTFARTLSFLTNIFSSNPDLLSLVKENSTRFIGYATSLYEYIMTRDGPPEAHSGEDTIKGCITGVYGLMLTLASWTIFKTLPGDDYIKKGIATATSVGALARAGKFTVDGVTALIEVSYNYVYEKYYGHPPLTGDNQMFLDEITAWGTSVARLRKRYDCQHAREKGFKEEVGKAYDAGCMIWHKTLARKPTPGVQAYVAMTMREMNYLMLKNDIYGNSFIDNHQVPFVLLMAGSSHVGKSTGSILLAASLIHNTFGLSKANFKDHIYNRNIEQVYFDGYRFQIIMIYDDWGQLKDTVGKPNLEYFELIRSANPSPMQCHMSTVEEKPNTPFLSKFILLTSNIHYHNPQSVNCAEAVRNRIDMAVTCRKNPDYVPKADEPIDPDYTQYAIYDPKIAGHHERNDMEWMSWAEFFRVVAEGYLKKKAQHDLMSDALEKTREHKFMPQDVNECQKNDPDFGFKVELPSESENEDEKFDVEFAMMDLKEEVLRNRDCENCGDCENCVYHNWLHYWSSLSKIRRECKCVRRCKCKKPAFYRKVPLYVSLRERDRKSLTALELRIVKMFEQMEDEEQEFYCGYDDFRGRFVAHSGGVSSDTDSDSSRKGEKSKWSSSSGSDADDEEASTSKSITKDDERKNFIGRVKRQPDSVYHVILSDQDPYTCQHYLNETRDNGFNSELGRLFLQLCDRSICGCDMACHHTLLETLHDAGIFVGDMAAIKRIILRPSVTTAEKIEVTYYMIAAARCWADDALSRLHYISRLYKHTGLFSPLRTIRRLLCTLMMPLYYDGEITNAFHYHYQSARNVFMRFAIEYPNATLCMSIVTGNLLYKVVKWLFSLLPGGGEDHAISEAKDEADETLSHKHEGLKIGSKEHHSHRCIDCAMTFSHTHVIKTEKISQKFPHRCRRCWAKFRKESPLDAFKTTISEMTSSGDPNTKSAKNLRFAELTSSGDPKTMKQTTRIFGEAEEEGEEAGVWNAKSLLGTAGALGAGLVAGVYGGDVFKRAELATAEQYSDANLVQVRRTMSRNMYKIIVHGPTSGSAYGFFLRGKTFLTIGHLVQNIKQGSKIELINENTKQNYIVDVATVTKKTITAASGKVRDMALLVFSHTVPDHRDMTSHLCTASEHAQFRKFKGMLLRAPGMLGVATIGDVVAQDREFSYTDSHKTYHERMAFTYNFETSYGDCGSLLLHVNKAAEKKLLAMHAAGENDDSGIGYAIPIFKEEIVRALTSVPITAQCDVCIDDNTDADAIPELPEGTFYPIGVLREKPGMPFKTKITPSLIHGQISEPTTKPAHLEKFMNAEGEIIDPLFKGLAKCGTPCAPIYQKVVNAAANDFLQVLDARETADMKRVFTDREAVEGIIGEPFAPPIKRATSAGYPWSMVFKNGKKELISETYELHPALEEAFQRREEHAKVGSRVRTYWTDTLKDERRPHEKVDAGKTRVFSNGPVDFTLVFRKYFLGFATACEKGRIDNEISVGTNCYSKDWERTVMKLQQKGTKVIAGDFSNFDGTLHIQILESILAVINAWYEGSEKENLVRWTLWREIVNSVHIANGNVYGWNHSQPSGCPITAILNSCYNSISMRYVFLRLAHKHDFSKASMTEFHRNVSMVSYGDDNVINISDNIPWFNQNTITTGYEELGMVYTDENKSTETADYRTLDDVSYLKRRFVYSPEVGRHIAPLAMETCLEMMNWVRPGLDKITATEENVANAVFEMALHGEETYDGLAARIRKVVRDEGLNVTIPTWDEMIHSRLESAVRWDPEFQV